MKFIISVDEINDFKNNVYLYTIDENNDKIFIKQKGIKNLNEIFKYININMFYTFINGMIIFKKSCVHKILYLSEIDYNNEMNINLYHFKVVFDEWEISISYNKKEELEKDRNNFIKWYKNVLFQEEIKEKYKRK